MEAETHGEYVQDAILAFLFALVAVVACYRSFVFFTFKGSGKVVTLFYVLIFTSSFFRAVWFVLPSTYLEGSYLPHGTVAFQDSHWKGVFVSELLLSVGTLSLYAVFILLISFWANMLNKVEQSEHSPQSLYEGERKPRGPLETFSRVMLAIIIMEASNITMFLFRVYNAEVMILFDSALFSVVSLTCLYGISFFSSRIRIILQTLGYINAKSTKQQVQRILAVTLAANIFFLLRVIIEVCIAITLVLHFLSNERFIFAKSHAIWSKFILFKHFFEVAMLALELVVSTSVSSRPHKHHSHKSSSTSESKRSNKPNKPRQSYSKEELLPTSPQPTLTTSSINASKASTSTPDRTSTDKTSTPNERTPLNKKRIICTKYSL